MLLKPNVVASLAWLASIAAASPQESPCRDAILCEDNIDDCGVMWGGCWNTCSPKESPTPPPCTVTTTPEPEPSPTSDDCRTRTVCVDGINSCGIPFGGCIPDCRPWDITTPPCPTVTTITIPTTTEPPYTTKEPTITDCSPGTICEDYIDPCGQTYGGCYDTCDERPTWTKPPCDPSCTKNQPKTTHY